MKVLVTGGAGFIASHVVDAMIEAGHDVAVVDNLASGRRSNLNPRARFYHVDIRDPELKSVFAAERPEVVDHHAAQMDVRKSMVDPLYDADVNIKGSLNLLDCARQYGVRRVIYISTGGAVYGEPKYLPCDESHPIEPLCCYGCTKHTVEHYLGIYKECYGLDYTVLRYPNVYGPRQDPHGEAGVIAIFTGRMLNGQEVIINGNGEQQRDYVYVSDCVSANLLAMDEHVGSGQIYNIGYGKGTTVNEIFTLLAEITRYGREPIYGPPKVGETFRIFLNAAKVRRELGWAPRVPLPDGLGRTVDYFRAGGEE